jgi:hypothetical protein
VAHSFSDFRNPGAGAGSAPLGFGTVLLLVGGLVAFSWPALADGGAGGIGLGVSPGGAGGTGFIGNPGANSGGFFTPSLGGGGGGGAGGGQGGASTAPGGGVSAAPVVAREAPTAKLEKVRSPPSSLAAVAVAAGASTATAPAPRPSATRLR